jgi:AraC-like DNA-binding protein
LRERLTEAVHLDALAAHAGLDKYHLCRAFHTQVGLPPHAYLTRLRIMRAKERLAAGERPSNVAPPRSGCGPGSSEVLIGGEATLTSCRYLHDPGGGQVAAGHEQLAHQFGVAATHELLEHHDDRCGLTIGESTQTETDHHAHEPSIDYVHRLSSSKAAHRGLCKGSVTGNGRELLRA